MKTELTEHIYYLWYPIYSPPDAPLGKPSFALSLLAFNFHALFIFSHFLGSGLPILYSGAVSMSFSNGSFMPVVLHGKTDHEIFLYSKL